MTTLSPERTRTRAALARATQQHKRHPDDAAAAAAVEDARRAYWLATARDKITTALEAVPDLTPEQRVELVAIIAAGTR